MKMLWLAMVLCSIAPAQPPAELPSYPGTAPIQVGDELAIGGERFRISYFTTADSVSEVAEYFYARWKEMGFPTMVEGHPEDGMTVSAFFTREGLQHAVVLRRRSGKTIGFATIRDLWSHPTGDARAKLFSPEAGVVWLHDVESRDRAARMTHRTTLVEGGLDAVAGALRAQLVRAAYALVGEAVIDRAGRRHLKLEHTGGDRRLVTYLAQVDDRATAIVQTCLGCVDAPPPAQRQEPSATGGPDP